VSGRLSFTQVLISSCLLISVHALTTLPTAGTLIVLPDTAGHLAAKTSRISACSLHADVRATLAPDSAGDQVHCLVCRGTKLEILDIPSLEPLMSFSSASAGLPVMDSSEGGTRKYTFITKHGDPTTVSGDASQSSLSKAHTPSAD